MTILKLRNNIFYITLIWLFVYSAVIPMQLSSHVLCIGIDGHVEVEFAINGSCADVPSLDVNDDHCEEHTESTDDHCGDCIDLPIFTSLNSELYIISNNDFLPLHDTQSLSTLSTFHSNLYPSISIISDIPPPIDPTLITLRTVLLLI